MSSSFGGLNTLVRGLYAQQVGLNTVGHNISNANTEGYSRQNVNLVTTSTENVFGNRGAMQLGTGVTVSSIIRARDTFVDKQMWKETSSLGYGQTSLDTFNKIEGVFSEPSDTGIQTVLNKFWSAWQTLSTNASDNGARTAVRQRGVEVVDAIQHSAQQLKDMISDINSVLKIKVDNVNQISSELASLNKQIVNIEVGGLDHANDLRDRRDLLVDQLSSMTSVRVTEDKYGNYNIQTAGITLVDGNGYTKLTTTPTAQDSDYGYEVVNVYAEGSTQKLDFTNGELKGLIAARDDQEVGAKGYLNQLSTMSEFLLKDFNAVHRSGYGADDSTNNNFFGDGDSGISDPNYSDPLVFSGTKGDWLSELRVNPDLFNGLAGLDKIAAKTSAGNLTVTKSNSAGGALNIGGTYTGASNVTFQVKIAADTLGNVTGATYSTDGSNWAPATINTNTTPPTFTIRDGLTVTIAQSSSNATNDIYTFTPPQGNASGDNAVRLGQALKVDVRDVLGSTYNGVFSKGSSLDTYYNSLISKLGIQTQNAERLTDNQKTLVSQLKNWRESTAGVNMDEEMTNMIRFQKGYNAAARVLTTMDEMLDKLINGTGVVGR